uniref:Uncharacterized protein n=1 Tax=viral metagenome TaxID=1070528 RepID=A0A6C0BNC9_9ZZZZ
MGVWYIAWWQCSLPTQEEYERLKSHVEARAKFRYVTRRGDRIYELMDIIDGLHHCCFNAAIIEFNANERQVSAYGDILGNLRIMKAYFPVLYERLNLHPTESFFESVANDYGDGYSFICQKLLNERS